MSRPVHRPDTARYYAFGAFDVTQDPPELVFVGLTRKAIREFIKWREDADNLRIRRAQFKPYQT